MRWTHRIAGFVTMVLAASACAQTSTLPATAPTQTSVSDLPSARPRVVASPGAAAGSGNIHWTGSMLTIDAHGESLRNLLRAVARSTGMKVTGGVPDEPVFGSYGPASVQTVLASLFDGLSVNMMLVNDTATQPKELLLTARTGGATPPSSRPLSDDDPAPVAAAPQGLGGPPQGIGRRPQGASPAVPGQATGQPVGPPPGVGGSTAGNLPIDAGAPQLNNQVNTDNGTGSTFSNGTTTDATTDTTAQPQSPNGTRTPEQIFEDLRKRQQGTTTTPTQ